MKVEALAGVVVEMPKARIVIELTDGQTVVVTGFVVRHASRESVVVLKAGRTRCRMSKG
jgi:hypothetical protein